MLPHELLRLGGVVGHGVLLEVRVELLVVLAPHAVAAADAARVETDQVVAGAQFLVLVAERGQRGDSGAAGSAEVEDERSDALVLRRRWTWRGSARCRSSRPSGCASPAGPSWWRTARRCRRAAGRGRAAALRRRARGSQLLRRGSGHGGHATAGVALLVASRAARRGRDSRTAVAARAAPRSWIGLGMPPSCGRGSACRSGPRAVRVTRTGAPLDLFGHIHGALRERTFPAHGPGGTFLPWVGLGRERVFQICPQRTRSRANVASSLEAALACQRC